MSIAVTRKVIEVRGGSSSYYRQRLAGIELRDDLDLDAPRRRDKATVVENFDATSLLLRSAAPT